MGERERVDFLFNRQLAFSRSAFHCAPVTIAYAVESALKICVAVFAGRHASLTRVCVCECVCGAVVAVVAVTAAGGAGAAPVMFIQLCVN